MWCMAATLWPPHCPPACSSSLSWRFGARPGGFDFGGHVLFVQVQANKETAGDRTNIASSVNVANFHSVPLANWKAA